MNAHLANLLAELAAFGDTHDNDPANRATRMLNITPDTGDFFAVLARPETRAAPWRFAGGRSRHVAPAGDGRLYRCRACGQRFYN